MARGIRLLVSIPPAPLSAQHPHEQTSLEVVSVGLLLNHVLGHGSHFLDRVVDIVLLAVPDRLFPANKVRGSSTKGPQHALGVELELVHELSKRISS